MERYRITFTVNVSKEHDYHSLGTYEFTVIGTQAALWGLDLRDSLHTTARNALRDALQDESKE